MNEIPAAELQRPIGLYAAPADSVVRCDQTIAEALTCLRANPPRGKILYVYVVDQQQRLKGVISTRALLLGNPEADVQGLMEKHLVSVSSEATLGEAMEVFAMHRLLALPVVDDQQHLVGVVDIRLYAEEAYELAQSDRMADLYQLIGMTGQLAGHRSARAGFRLRMPWLACNVLGGLLCAGIAWGFEKTLADVILLALFIPMVLTLSESISMQAMTLSLQLLHGTGVKWPILRKRLWVEYRTALLLGLSCGLAVGLLALLWRPGPGPILVISLAVTIAMTCSATLGVLVPALLHARHLDPQVAAGPVVLVIGDAIAMAVYLGLGAWWL